MLSRFANLDPSQDRSLHRLIHPWPFSTVTVSYHFCDQSFWGSLSGALFLHMGVRHLLWVVVAVSWLCLQARVLHSLEDLVCNSSDSEALLDLMSNFESPVDGWGLNVSANCCD